MKLERFFGILKDRFLERKANARVDELIYRLIQYFNWKTQDLLIKQLKGKCTDSSQQINISHSRSNQIHSSQIQNLNSTTWLVQSTNSNSSYIVKRSSPSAEQHCCEAKCKQCGVCIHMYICSCPQNIFGKICKHIHAVHKLFNKHDDPILVTEPFQYLEDFTSLSFTSKQQPQFSQPNLKDTYKQLTAEIDSLLEVAGDELPEVTEIAVDHLTKSRNEIICVLQKRGNILYGVPQLAKRARYSLQIRF